MKKQLKYIVFLIVKRGGRIGWVYKSQLSNKISKQIENIKVGEFTDPITVPGGFIILKLVDKKKSINKN